MGSIRNQIRSTQEWNGHCTVLLSRIKCQRASQLWTLERSTDMMRYYSMPGLGTLRIWQDTWFKCNSVRAKRRLLEKIIPPHKAIGALSFIEKSDHINENCFFVDQPVSPTFFKELTKTLLESESAKHIRREIHLNVIGLMNEWDRTGYLDVTEFKLVLSCFEHERQSEYRNQET